MFLNYPADYWRAKHCCDAVSQLTCTAPLCCVTDTTALTEGGLLFSLVSSLRSFRYFSPIIRPVKSLRHKSPLGESWEKKIQSRALPLPKRKTQTTPTDLTQQKNIYLVHSKARNMVLKTVQPNATSK